MVVTESGEVTESATTAWPNGAARARLLADRLFAAHSGGVLLPPPPPDLAMVEAEAVRDAVFARRGGALAGYKLAATSAAAQSGLGVGGPLVGLIGAGEVVPAGAIVAPAAPLYAEAELVFRIGADLPPARKVPARADLAAAIDGVFAGIELCASRFRDDEVPAPALVADNCFLHALVLGDQLPGGWDEGLAAMPTELHRSGQPAVSGSTERVMGDPLAALASLVLWLGARGEGLRAGQLVASGSTTGITPVSPGTEIAAEFGGRGTVRLQLMPSTPFDQAN